MAERADLHPLATGPVCTVWVAMWQDGEAPARKHWEKLSREAQAALYTRFEATCTVNCQWPPTKLRHLRDGIWEFKTNRPLLRAMAFQYGKDWYITHINPKPGKKELQTDIESCRTIRDWHLQEMKRRDEARLKSQEHPRERMH